MPAFIAIPDEIDPGKAGKVLVDLLEWIRWFMGDVVAHSTDKYPHIFVPDLIKRFPDALRELEANRSFEEIEGNLLALSERAIEDNGLFGAQLQWKMATIDYANKMFSENPDGKLLDWVLDGIGALLESMLEGILGGSAIIGLNESIRHAIDRTASP